MKTRRIALMGLAVAAVVALARADEPKSPDEIWSQIQQLQRATSGRQPATDTEKRAILEVTDQLIGTADDFWQRFPDDGRMWQAKLILLQARQDRANVEGKDQDLKAIETDVH